ncbi:hypothetical protein [Thermosinus carboxydivorans]|uniref:hypothetical protein n=1 Tax=Thermosinus carboxydivorans TaxID=261685 RepID=UPI0005942D70|nr:hypothetical protein [Thermosinus carboxydivorans]
MAQSKKDIWTACLPKVKQLLGDITGSEITVTACLPQNDTFSSAGLAVITRFTGKASGRIILDMSKETARKLSAVINGQDKGDDEFVVDTIWFYPGSPRETSTEGKACRYQGC